MRGTGPLGMGPGRFRGITPACAGNSISPIIIGSDKWDHPRVCGEQFNTLQIGYNIRGSPPRVRGTVPPQRPAPVVGGITPACAGNSLSKSKGRIETEDHPRVCGEQLTRRNMTGSAMGSPPRVRGTVCIVCLFPVFQGITPACAGNRTYSLAHYKIM